MKAAALLPGAILAVVLVAVPAGAGA